MNNKNMNKILIIFIIILLIYSGFMTYEHFRGKMLIKEINDKIEKNRKEHNIEPATFEDLNE